MDVNTKGNFWKYVYSFCERQIAQIDDNKTDVYTRKNRVNDFFDSRGVTMEY